MLAFKKFIPLLNRVMIKKVEAVTKTKGGILLPESNKEQLNYGTVMAVGPGRFQENGQIRPCNVKEGDVVLLPEYGGSKITLHGDAEFFIYRDDDIMGTLHDPTK
jgi:chaperonin GroES